MVVMHIPLLFEGQDFDLCLFHWYVVVKASSWVGYKIYEHEVLVSQRHMKVFNPKAAVFNLLHKQHILVVGDNSLLLND